MLIAGGGTGGHVFPMIAVADAMRAAAPTCASSSSAPSAASRRASFPRAATSSSCCDVLPIGAAPSARRVALVRAAATLPRARRLLTRLAPRAVLSVGGYAAGPVALVAGLSRVPLAILEPNSVLGLANRWLAPFARRAYIAFPETAARLRGGSGAPHRRSAARQVRAEPVSSRRRRSVRVLVLGGSQGARVLNEALPAALARAAREVAGLSILHQAGRGRDDDVRRAYARAPAPRRAWSPFLDDVARELALADIVIARSGAGSVAELCAVGRAAHPRPVSARGRRSSATQRGGARASGRRGAS